MKFNWAILILMLFITTSYGQQWTILLADGKKVKHQELLELEDDSLFISNKEGTKKKIAVENILELRYGNLWRPIISIASGIAGGYVGYYAVALLIGLPTDEHIKWGVEDSDNPKACVETCFLPFVVIGLGGAAIAGAASGSIISWKLLGKKYDLIKLNHEEKKELIQSLITKGKN